MIPVGSTILQVALLAEGVDRNCIKDTAVALSTTVALLAEGVDRNSGSHSPAL